MAEPIYLSSHEDFSVLVDAVEKDAKATIGPERLARASELAVYCVWSRTAHGGKVVVEGAHSVGHQGPWYVLKTFDWSEPGKADYASIAGAHLAVRFRVAEAILTGSVTVYATGN